MPLTSNRPANSSRPLTRNTPPRHPLAVPKSRSKQFFPSQSVPKHKVQKVRIYHDSNLRWSSPSEIKRSFKDLQLGNAEEYDIALSYTPTLDDALHDVEHHDNRNTLVVISTMTNNAKSHQAVTKTKSLLQQLVEKLKRQVLSKNIIFLESPPSRNFDIFPYNQMASHLCKSLGVMFALNLVARPHIKPDGLHILPQFKYLMVTSAAAAIAGREPYGLLGLKPLRRPFFS